MPFDMRTNDSRLAKSRRKATWPNRHPDTEDCILVIDRRLNIRRDIDLYFCQRVLGHSLCSAKVSNLPAHNVPRLFQHCRAVAKQLLRLKGSCRPRGPRMCIARP